MRSTTDLKHLLRAPAHTLAGISAADLVPWAVKHEAGLVDGSVTTNEIAE
jgi:hypothetical protein